MRPFRIIEWRDSAAPGQVDWYERTFKTLIDDLWSTQKLRAAKPIYKVCTLQNASSFREFFLHQCRLHRPNGNLLGIICHGNASGLMASTNAQAPGILNYDSFWGAVELGLGRTDFHAIAFGSCEAMSAPLIHTRLAPTSVTGIIGYTGQPQAVHALRLLAGLSATMAIGFDAVQIAIEDGGGARELLKTNFDDIGEFLETNAPDPHYNPGFRRDPADVVAGEAQILVREWQRANPLRLL